MTFSQSARRTARRPHADKPPGKSAALRQWHRRTAPRTCLQCLPRFLPAAASLPRRLAVFFRALEFGHVLAQHAPGYPRQLLPPLREVEQEKVGSRLPQLHRPKLYARNRELKGKSR